jgi:hypothetical protein
VSRIRRCSLLRGVVAARITESVGGRSLWTAQPPPSTRFRMTLRELSRRRSKAEILREFPPWSDREKDVTILIVADNERVFVSPQNAQCRRF